MYERITRIGKYIAAVILAAILFTACTCSAPPVKPKPVSPPPPGVSQPEIMNIIGVQKWNPGKENTLLCAARDPDGNQLTYIWTAENGTIKGSGEKVIWLPPDTIGDYEISVKVNNGKGGEASFSKRFTVTNPPPPEPDKTVYLRMSVPSQNVATAEGRIRSFNTAEIQCDVEGRDPTELTYTWVAYGGRLHADGLSEGKASRVGWDAPQGGQDRYKVTVLVADKEGNQATGEVNFEVLCCRDP
jgi:hypothetical protein